MQARLLRGFVLCARSLDVERGPCAVAAARTPAVCAACACAASRRAVLRVRIPRDQTGTLKKVRCSPRVKSQSPAISYPFPSLLIIIIIIIPPRFRSPWHSSASHASKHCRSSPNTRRSGCSARTTRCLRVEAALKQRLSRYELPEELRLEHRLEHSAGEHDAFDNRYRGMARRLDQHIKTNHQNPPAPARRSKRARTVRTARMIHRPHGH